MPRALQEFTQGPTLQPCPCKASNPRSLVMKEGTGTQAPHLCERCFSIQAWQAKVRSERLCEARDGIPLTVNDRSWQVVWVVTLLLRRPDMACC